MECDQPNAELYEFHGNLKYEGKNYPLNADQLLLKGSKLKNTDFVIGSVVYTGNDTKMMKNSNKSRFKQSMMEKRMNQIVFYLLYFQIFFCTIAAVIGYPYVSQDVGTYTYLYVDNLQLLGFIQCFMKYFILLSTFIPISLIVTIEVVKVCQGIFISYDAEMYCEESMRWCNVSSASLNEELG